MLYQLGILTILESIGHSLLPSAISGASKKDQRDFSAYLSVEAYKKLHEVALKGIFNLFLDCLQLKNLKMISWQIFCAPSKHLPVQI